MNPRYAGQGTGMDASTLAKRGNTSVLVRAALGTGAQVRFVAGGPGSPGGNGRAPAHGVGTLLRYAD